MKKLNEVRIAEANLGLGKPERRVFFLLVKERPLVDSSGETPYLNLLLETIVNKYSPESVLEAIHHSPLKKL